MKPGKTSKNFEGRSVYERMTAVFFDSNPVEDLNETVHQEFMGYGTAAHEFMNEKKVLMEMARTQSDQIRNSNIEVNRKIIFERALADSTSYIIVEEFDFHDVDNGHHYSMRLSTILEKTDGRWLVSHMHGSTPDSNIAEEEALPMEGLRRKNRELEKKIKEGIREAELEAALERIRSSSLAMQKPDDLGDVVSVLFEQMQELSVDMGFASVSIFIFEVGTWDFTQWLPLPDGVASLHVPYIDHPISSDLFDARESGTDYFEKVYSVEEKNAWAEKGFELTDYKNLPGEFKTSLLEAPGYAMSISLAKHSGICIPSFEGKLPSSENVAILKRVGKVFEQAYTRFLDLQKAEAQTREAQIEAALEKVRSRSLAMHQSEELKDVVKEIFDQLAHLGVNAEHAGIVVDYEPEKDWHFWVAETQDIPSMVTVPYLDLVWDRQFTEAIREGKPFFTTQLNFDEKNSFYQKLLPHVEGLTEEARDFYFSCPGLAISTTIEEDIGLYIENFSGTPYSEEENKILKRFGKVFQQAYTRFLDLQKAEAQARKAQIEVAVERVRAKALAMHKSTEILQVAITLKEQMEGLNVSGITAATIYLEHDDNKIRVWDITELKESENGPQLSSDFTFRLEDTDPNLWVRRIWNTGGKYHVIEMSGDDFILCENWIREFDETAADNYRKFIRVGKIEHTWHPTVQLEKGKLNLDFSVPPPSEMEFILPKMGVAFDLAYRRFLDLQKAEAQAREAQVNLAVERVRARALAMFKSEEILEVVYKLKEEIMGLDIPNVTASTIHLKEPDGRYRAWDLTSINEEENELEISLDIRWRIEDTHPNFFMREVWDRTEDYFVVIQGEDRYKHTVEWLHQNGHSDYAEEFEEFLETSQVEKAYHPTVPLNNGRMCIDMLETPDPEVESILKKMAGAFDLAYKRFEDLQKAEAQARESEIQLALERVRARTMAMKKSDELREAVLVIYEQLEQLHFEATACNIIIMDKESGSMQYWVSGFTQDIYPESYHVPFLNHPYLNAQIEPWKQGEKYAVMEYSGEEKKRFDEIFFSKTGFKNVPEQAKLAMKSLKMVKLSTAYCRYGALQVFGLEPLSEKKGEILRRFAKVFEQTYTRFLDLQKAEAQTREVQIEAALERARAQSMMMQHSDEINTISNAFHEQLILLGIPSEFSYVWLPDEENQSHQFWASWSEMSNGENRLQSKQVTYPLDKSEPYTAACFAAWATPDVVMEEFIPPLDIAGFFDVWKELLSGAKKLKPEYFQEGIYYSEAYMRYGCFGINIRRKLSEEEKNILKRFSKEFERAYTRFLDLQKAEEQALLIREERDRLEIALNKLKATQDQLIQQEKLASLGQLTAGIAHEIKNPLNFVNNFSDVSVELVEEAKDELSAFSHQLSAVDAGKVVEALLILEDIEANLRKIHEHGTRADSIVKSMLQHSRGGDGKMEPSPLNPLIKEYVNLAFHGMRAGKEPINVDIDLQLDDSIGEIPLVAEDFSRVILNLCNNAFDAMREKGIKNSELKIKNYSPWLTVRTKVENGKVVVEVEDNGPGIPEDIKHKILQPFFTTKKGTAGTGLGLSITNDIIKAHGGELKVETKDGAGTALVIQLPMKPSEL